MQNGLVLPHVPQLKIRRDISPAEFLHEEQGVSAPHQALNSGHQCLKEESIKQLAMEINKDSAG